MTWIDRLEARFGRIAIPHLVQGLVFLNAVVWIALQVNPKFGDALALDPKLILAGEVWRLVTFLFIPGTSSLFVVFYLMFLWMMGDALEAEWGAFRLNAYYLLGMVGTILSAFFFRADPTGVYLNLSLYFAFATLFPNFQLLLFFIIPMQIKWLALFSAGVLVFMMFLGDNPTRLAIAASFINYFVFFGPYWIDRWRGPQAVDQRNRERQAKLMEAIAADEPSMHACSVCGRTEFTNPELDFRVSSADDREYCREHLPKG